MNPAEHLEHVEHHGHATSSFDKRVAVTVAILAALLATFHSLERHAEAVSLKLEVQSGKDKTEAADQWAYYQAKNIRKHLYQGFGELSELMPAGNDAAKTAARKRWDEQLKTYNKEMPEHRGKAQELEKRSDELHHQSEGEHHLAVSVGRSTLFLELGIVITSLAVLTRKSLFWYVGLLLGVTGTAYGAYVVLPHYLGKGH